MVQQTPGPFCVCLLVCVFHVVKVSPARLSGVSLFSGANSQTEPASVCYSLAGSSGETCYSNAAPFDNANNLLPDSPADIGTKFYLYTRGAAAEQIFTDSLTSSSRLQNRETKLIVHGWGEDVTSDWVQDMVSALLGVGKFNVIVVDWGKGASGWNYNQAVANTRLVGTQVGLLLQALEAEIQISHSSVHIIGFSLGAHISGYAGQIVSGLGRISGLDPAGPCFHADEPQIRLTQNDATYVDTLHTNGGSSLLNGLGIFQPLGTSNFYPSGGKSQPGCGRTAAGTKCSHMRATTLYIESIKGVCKFESKPCEPGSVCDTCGSEGCARMGYYAQTDGASGSYYLTTTDTAPFC